jgi:hypothetical protein
MHLRSFHGDPSIIYGYPWIIHNEGAVRGEGRMGGRGGSQTN